MKLPRLNSGKARLPIHIVFSLTGLAVAAIIATAMAFSTNGISHAAIPAATHAMFDEVQIQLGANGFSPAELQHDAGTFAIAVDNTGVSGAYTLRVKAADGTVVKEVAVEKGSAAWTMTLAAGEYTLTEASHSEWSCRITLQ